MHNKVFVFCLRQGLLTLRSSSPTKGRDQNTFNSGNWFALLGHGASAA